MGGVRFSLVRLPQSSTDLLVPTSTFGPVVTVIHIIHCSQKHSRSVF